MIILCIFKLLTLVRNQIKTKNLLTQGIALLNCIKWCTGHIQVVFKFLSNGYLNLIVQYISLPSVNDQPCVSFYFNLIIESEIVYVLKGLNFFFLCMQNVWFFVRISELYVNDLHIPARNVFTTSCFSVNDRRNLNIVLLNSTASNHLSNTEFTTKERKLFLDIMSIY